MVHSRIEERPEHRKRGDRRPRDLCEEASPPRQSATQQTLREDLTPAAAELGVTLHSAEVKDVMFPGDLKRIFAEVVRAQKEGQAALERARGETAALRNLANAAKMLEDNPALFNLRVLQSVSGGAQGSTVVVGVPQGVVPVPRGGEPGRRGGGSAPDQG